MKKEHVFILTCSTGIIGVFRDYTDAFHVLEFYENHRFRKLKIEQHTIS